MHQADLFVEDVDCLVYEQDAQTGCAHVVEHICGLDAQTLEDGRDAKSVHDRCIRISVLGDARSGTGVDAPRGKDVMSKSDG